MSRRIRARIVAALTAIAWVGLAADAILSDDILNLTDGQSVLMGCASVAGSLVLAGWARSRPVADVYDMGEAAGYRRAKIEAAVNRSGGTVLPMRRRAE